MILENKLNITNQVELAMAEEKLSKKRALEMYGNLFLDNLEIGTFDSLSKIHKYLFNDVYYFAGDVRTENISKGSFKFAPVIYLKNSLNHIDTMPNSNFNEIVEKYVEMNIAHPFREGNGRSSRIWLDLMLKKVLNKVVDWTLIDKEFYFQAMERSIVKDIEIKYLLKESLTNNINSKLLYMNGIDTSYYFEGYNKFKISKI